MSKPNVRRLEHPEVKALAERFAAARNRKRQAAGVSHQLRASLRAGKEEP